MAVCLALTPAAGASAVSYTWAGASTTSEDWSFPANWAGEQAPTASTKIETLTFPRLTSAACTLEEELHPCYISYNNVSGLTAESIKIDDGDEYLIGGDELTLGSGGLTAVPASGTSEEALDLLDLPLSLSASQAWSVAGHNGGLAGENGLLVAKPVEGAGAALTVALSSAAALYLASGVEVGPLMIEGSDTGEAGVFNGFAGLLGGELNATNEEPVELSHIFFVGDGAVGKLTTNHAELAVGSGGMPAKGIQAASVKLDPNSEVAFDIAGEGSAPKEDYSQLDAHGPIALEDAKIGIEVSPPEPGQPCPKLTPGQTYTFVSTTGALSGAFANAPEGGPEIPVKFAKACSQLPEKLRISYHESGGTQTVTGTIEGGERAPEVTREPSSSEVVKGEEASFEVAASGAPTPTVQWELSTNSGGTWGAVAGATSDTLTVASTKTTESGDEYRAVFTNSAGKAETTSASLTVDAKPVAPAVTKEPVGESLLEGEEATFEASASGAPAPTVRWELSTDHGATWSAIAGAMSGALKLAGVKTSQSGDEYRAVFTNSANKAETAPAILTVDAAPQITRSPVSIEVDEGGEASFEAAASGVPAPTVQWELSTNNGATWNSVAGASSDTLTVADVKPSESGDEYRAVFTNSASKAETAPATLTVDAAPQITRSPASVEVGEGGEARFEAAASGVPSPTVQWELSTNKGGTWSATAGATSDVLRLSDVKPSESGEYRAVFTNAGGKAQTTSATLIVYSVQAAPEVPLSEKPHEEEPAKSQVLGFAGSSPGPTAEASPDAVMASASLQATASGAVSITISCPDGVTSCAGTVTLRTLDAVRAAADPRAKPAILTLAAGSFTVPGGGVKRVTLHLSAKARALLARSHELRVRTTILAHNPTGGTHTGQKVVLLRAPKAKPGQR